MRARIFRQPKSAMQSGTAHTDEWVLLWEPAVRQVADALMGWNGGGAPQGQVKLRFATREEAVCFAAAQGIEVEVELPPVRVRTPKVYADNFKYGRLENWTH